MREKRLDAIYWSRLYRHSWWCAEPVVLMDLRRCPTCQPPRR